MNINKFLEEIASQQRQLVRYELAEVANGYEYEDTIDRLTQTGFVDGMKYAYLKLTGKDFDDEYPPFKCPQCTVIVGYIEGSGDCQTCQNCCTCPDDAWRTGKYCMPY